MFFIVDGAKAPNTLIVTNNRNNHPTMMPHTHQPLKNLSPYQRESLALMAQLSPREAQAINALMDTKQKHLWEALLYCLLLGGVGGHQFYLNHTKTGWAYLLLSWTLFPLCLALIDALFLAKDIQQYNLNVKCQVLRQVKTNHSPLV
jgi:TM2 domain-containing membrane protein YozV